MKRTQNTDPTTRPRIMKVTSTGNVKLVKNPNYNPNKQSTPSQPSACDHPKVSLAFDLDLMASNQIVETNCVVCLKTILIRITTYSLTAGETRAQGCTKRQYEDRKSALTILNQCRKEHRKVQPKRVYECPRCKFWHLTSQSRV